MSERDEDAFVELLLEVADGHVADERDVDLARAAGRWAAGAGRWAPHPHGGFIVRRGGLDWWVACDSTGMQLQLRARLATGADWCTYGPDYPVAHLGHGLNVLAIEGLIPPRFCTLGRDALEDLARAQDRTAAIVADLLRNDEMFSLEAALRMRVRIDTLHEAADSARRFAGVPMAVLA